MRHPAIEQEEVQTVQRRDLIKTLVAGVPALALGFRSSAQTSETGSADSSGAKPLRPSDLLGNISEVTVGTAAQPTPLASSYVSADADLNLMAAWALRHLVRNPRPALNYEPVFMVRPLHVPPAPVGHDPIVPGDTDCRMDWEFIYMREITGSQYGLDVQRKLRERILGYVQDDGLAWVTPGARMEGAVYGGKGVPEQKEAWPWTTGKILRSLSETYARTKDVDPKKLARKMFLALQRLASWDSGRAYFAGPPWHGNNQIGGGPAPAAALEPIVRYWETTGDEEALRFSVELAEGMIASTELEAPADSHSITSRLYVSPTGEFHGHMHSTLNSVWGVAHLGTVMGNSTYIEWAKRVYDYATQFGTETGWISAALWDNQVREQSETCATADMISLASWIAKAGFSDYWDHVERMFRNYVQPFQFFATPEYEAMYRELNKDNAESDIRAGLLRMKDLQGAVWGGPAPNDSINWIASSKQYGPYGTPFGIAALYGCCMAEGMRALYTVWSSVVTANERQEVFVNLSLNRDSELARVISSLPEQGRIDVIPRKAGVYFLRPPSWAPRSKVRVARAGREVPVEWGGPGLAYVQLKHVEPKEVLTLVYPLVTRKQVIGIWPTKPDLKITTRWNGNTVVDMEPRGKGLPVTFAKRGRLPPLEA